MRNTKTIHLPNGTHTYCDYGQGVQPLVLLHGLSFRQGLYPLMDRLAPDFRVIALDLPLSDRVGFKRPITLEAFADLILDFKAALGLDSPAFFGNSLGGTLGLICALKDPEAFPKMVVRAPFWTQAQLPGYLRMPGLIPAHIALSRFELYAQYILALVYRQSVRRSPAGGNGGQRHPAENHLALFHRYLINPVLLSIFIGRLLQVELSDRIERIWTHTLVLWGARDAVSPSLWGARLAERLPNARFLAAPDEYHDLVTIDTEKMAGMMRDFLAD